MVKKNIIYDYMNYVKIEHDQVKKNWPPQYNWNIVESGVKHHKPKLKPFFFIGSDPCAYYSGMQILKKIERMVGVVFQNVYLH
jgi:hypothetical protein